MDYVRPTLNQKNGQLYKCTILLGLQGNRLDLLFYRRFLIKNNEIFMLHSDYVFVDKKQKLPFVFSNEMT